jgi:hypothetical protein
MVSGHSQSPPDQLAQSPESRIFVSQSYLIPEIYRTETLAKVLVHCCVQTRMQSSHFSRYSSSTYLHRNRILYLLQRLHKQFCLTCTSPLEAARATRTDAVSTELKDAVVAVPLAVNF